MPVLVRLISRKILIIRNFEKNNIATCRLAVLLSIPVILCALFFVGVLPADNNKPVVVRNDMVPLQKDLEIGRFGSGKLYFDDPVDLTLDDDENIYILDAGNHRIQVADEKGRYLYQWGSRGKQDGSLDEPVAMTINHDSEYVAVLDQGNYRVNKYDFDGTYILSFGEKGIRKGMFREPVDLAIDGLDYIYVLDRERKVVLKFHETGVFVEEWGNMGRKDDLLEDPVSIAYSDELTGFIYVLDAKKMALQKYKRDGDLVEIINLLPDAFEMDMIPLKVETNHENEIFVLDGLNGKLIKLNRRGINVFQLTSTDLVMDKPAGLAIDEENRVYVSDLRKNRFIRFLMELD